MGVLFSPVYVKSKDKKLDLFVLHIYVVFSKCFEVLFVVEWLQVKVLTSSGKQWSLIQIMVLLLSRDISKDPVLTTYPCYSFQYTE